MSKHRNYYGTFTERPPSEESSESDDYTEFDRPVNKGRKANIYDAVAGNVTQAGLLGRIKDPRASRQPLRPDEVLFKQANAPIRYEETDYYFAHERLPAEQQLPAGELLTAVHAYISKFFVRNPCPEMEKAWKCMDETALIAFGILLEETTREVLGETGDLAFTEAADEEEERVLAGGGDDGEGEQQSEPEPGGRKASLSPLSSSDDSSDYTSDGTD